MSTTLTEYETVFKGGKDEAQTLANKLQDAGLDAVAESHGHRYHVTVPVDEATKAREICSS